MKKWMRCSRLLSSANKLQLLLVSNKGRAGLGLGLGLRLSVSMLSWNGGTEVGGRWGGPTAASGGFVKKKRWGGLVDVANKSQVEGSKWISSVISHSQVLNKNELPDIWSLCLSSLSG